MVARSLVFLVVLVVMGTIMNREIIKPVKALSETITRVTRTGNFEEKLPQSSRDEIGLLMGAFNDMMEELTRRTVQSRESDERYRRFIEVAASTVITFLQDGRIVIANKKAEDLFGRSKQELLGESIFKLLEEGAALEEKLASDTEFSEETSIQTVLGLGGKPAKVEMVVSASKTDREPMFTAILRERNQG
jgi:PAS domain S-box-containing protein